MLQNYIAYDRRVKPLYSHPKINILCDLLHIEQKDNFSIVSLNSLDLFRQHTAQELKKLYLNLGGDSSLFTQAATLYTHHEEIRQECIRLAIALPIVQVNGFEAEMQANWIDRLPADIKCGYRYLAGSNVPAKV